MNLRKRKVRKSTLTLLSVALTLGIFIMVYSIIIIQEPEVPERTIRECYEAALECRQDSNKCYRCQNACINIQGEPIKENAVEICMQGDAEELWED